MWWAQNTGARATENNRVIVLGEINLKGYVCVHVVEDVVLEVAVRAGGLLDGCPDAVRSGSGVVLLIGKCIVIYMDVHAGNSCVDAGHSPVGVPAASADIVVEDVPVDVPACRGPSASIVVENHQGRSPLNVVEDVIPGDKASAEIFLPRLPLAFGTAVV